jgi:hypothetical protein
MELPAAGRRAIDGDQSPVHRWRVSQLARLGIPRPLAEVYAERVDWHQIAGLVRRAAPRGWPCASSADARRRIDRDDRIRKLA